MDFWPTDNRVSTGKQKAKETSSSGFNYEQGKLGGATLVDQSGHLEWAFVLKHNEARKLDTTAPVKVFPITRPPSFSLSTTNVVQRAELGANFLRTHLPDVDVAADLIREELTADSGITQELADFDPFEGNLLEVVSRQETNGKVVSSLAFPMGELNCDLNISPFLFSKATGTTFKPSAWPVKKFNTPIQQIVASKLSSTAGLQKSFLAVRTFGATSILDVNASPQATTISDLTSITRSDVGDRRIVDVKFSQNLGQTILVNDRGSVHTCRVDSGVRSMNVILGQQETTMDSFWRIGLGDMNTCHLASRTELQHLDLRTQKPTCLFSTSLPEDIITFVEDRWDDHLVRLTSMRQLIWIDQRVPGKPLLSYNHRRQLDRSLETRTITVDSSHVTLLTSRRNSLVTVYDVSLSQGLVQFKSAPYCFSGPPHVPYAGLACFQQSETRDTSFFTLSEHGSIHRIDLRVSSISPQRLDWTSDVRNLDNSASRLRPNAGTLGDQERTIENLSPIYDNIYQIFNPEEASKIENANAQAVHQLVEQVPVFWQNLDDPAEHMLTGFDVVFRAGDEPAQSSRADFLTGSIFNSTRGYRALDQGRISAVAMGKDAGWHCNLRPMLAQLECNVADDINGVTEALRDFDLLPDSECSPQSLHREKESREQLALDLTLAADVFSAQPFTKTTTMDNNALETMTESLSLNSEPPPLEFHYFRLPGRGEEAPETYPFGVRLLLNDWEVGTDPEDFIYQDPYRPQQAVVAGQRATRTMPVIAFSQPPMVVAAAPAVLPSIIESRRISNIGVSQPPMPLPSTQPLDFDSQESSMPMMANSQILPGAFGGRPSVSKKKKRVGGFYAIHIDLNRAKGHETGLTSPALVPYGWKKSPVERPGCTARFSSMCVVPLLSGIFVRFTASYIANKAVVCALSASYISTFAGYPLDSLKSRLQTNKQYISVPRLAAIVYREEGVRGFYRGLWIPLMTISFVRAASFTIYNRSKEAFRDYDYLQRNSIIDVSIIGGISGGLSGALISFGSAPFELVKVRRQLEYTIAASKGIHLVKPPGTMEAVKEIFRTNVSLSSFFVSIDVIFKVRDTLGTGLYFSEYDAMRHLLGRSRTGEQGPTPPWLPIPASLVPFVCGSFAGVTSWALIYPLDVVKTKVQQRALAGERFRGVFETFHRLIRGPDPNAPKPFLAGMARIYRGLGVSAVRSITTHGLLWTFFDFVGNYIDRLPPD
ncbi:hypothetical protein C8J56DRAFT_1057231 [Mycena floridula]|nr:hypothetical protein C8J56DRAFT_1057231 [Mycena floridula]